MSINQVLALKAGGTFPLVSGQEPPIGMSRPHSRLSELRRRHAVQGWHSSGIMPPQTAQISWNLSGEAVVDLFASEENTHCLLFFSVTSAPLRGMCYQATGQRNARMPFPRSKSWCLCCTRSERDRRPAAGHAKPAQSAVVFRASGTSGGSPWPVPLRRDLLSGTMGTMWHSMPEL